MFYYGVACYWALQWETSNGWFYLTSALFTLSFLSPTRNDECWVALFTGLVIFYVGKTGRLNSWLNFGWLQFLGRISYSLYLVHYVIGLSIQQIGRHISGDSPRAEVVWFFISLGASIVGAWILYRLVEVPGVKLAKRLKTESPLHAL